MVCLLAIGGDNNPVQPLQSPPPANLPPQKAQGLYKIFYYELFDLNNPEIFKKHTILGLGLRGQCLDPDVDPISNVLNKDEIKKKNQQVCQGR